MPTSKNILIGLIPICGKCSRNPTALLFCDINLYPCQIATKGINWISKLLCFDFRKVEYFNAKGSLVDKNTVKALDRHQNEVSIVICLYVWIRFHSLRLSGWPRNPLPHWLIQSDALQNDLRPGLGLQCASCLDFICTFTTMFCL